MAKKNPSTRWFFNDWHNDEPLQICSLAARGAWIELLTICALNNGYLVIHDTPPTIAALARYVGAPPGLMGRVLKELENNGVFSRNEEGVIFNRRMTRAHDTRVRAQCDPRTHSSTSSFLHLSSKDSPLNPPAPQAGGLSTSKIRKRKKGNGAAPPEDSPKRGPDYGPAGPNGASWETVVDDWFRAKANGRRPFWGPMWSSPAPGQPGCEAPPEIIRRIREKYAT
jgi:hypothetical protein